MPTLNPLLATGRNRYRPYRARMRQGMAWVVVSLGLPPEELARIDRYVFARSTNRSRVLRVAVSEYLDREEDARERELTAREVRKLARKAARVKAARARGGTK